MITLGFQLGIPVKEVDPAFMQVIGRELAAKVTQLFRRRRAAACAGSAPSAAGFWSPCADCKANRPPRRFPRSDPALGARNYVVKCQIPLRSAVLTLEFIPQKQIKAREGHALFEV